MQPSTEYSASLFSKIAAMPKTFSELRAACGQGFTAFQRTRSFREPAVAAFSLFRHTASHYAYRAAVMKDALVSN